jgi:hypothetical protein
VVPVDLLATKVAQVQEVREVQLELLELLVPLD